MIGLKINAVTYDEVSCHGYCQDNTIDTDDLKDGQPVIGSASIGMLYGWNLNYGSDERDAKVSYIAPTSKKVSPIDNEAYEDLAQEGQGNDFLRRVDKARAKFAHLRTFHHLTDQPVRYDDDPDPSCFVIEALQTADPLLLPLLVQLVFIDVLSRKGTGFALLSDDLE